MYARKTAARNVVQTTAGGSNTIPSRQKTMQLVIGSDGLHCSHCVVSSMTTMSVFPCLQYKFRCAFSMKTFENGINTVPDEIGPFLLLMWVKHSITRCMKICWDCLSVRLLMVFHTRLLNRAQRLSQYILLGRLRSEAGTSPK